MYTCCILLLQQMLTSPCNKQIYCTVEKGLFFLTEQDIYGIKQEPMLMQNVFLNFGGGGGGSVSHSAFGLELIAAATLLRESSILYGFLL